MSDAQKINFELVSPEEKLVSEPVKMAVIPGVEGEMGVGSGHSAFVVALKPGVVKLFKEQGPAEGGKADHIFIAGGFADVTGESCVILAEDAVNVNEIDTAALEKELPNLDEDLGMAATPADKARVRKKIALVKAKLSAAKGTLVL